MDHKDFHIGHAFATAAALWRCTDIGTRTVIAVRLDRGEVCHNDKQADGSWRRWTETIDRRQPQHAAWLNGPPYACAELVFDEYDLEDCQPVAEDAIAAWQPRADLLAAADFLPHPAGPAPDRHVTLIAQDQKIVLPEGGLRCTDCGARFEPGDAFLAWFEADGHTTAICPDCQRQP